MFRDKLIKKNIGAKNNFRWRSHETTHVDVSANVDAAAIEKA